MFRRTWSMNLRITPSRFDEDPSATDQSRNDQSDGRMGRMDNHWVKGSVAVAICLHHGGVAGSDRPMTEG